jgi:hypothetical protein
MTKKICVLEEWRLCVECGECDICDVDRHKKCDNCMECIAVKADYAVIKIDEIIGGKGEADA